MRFAIYKNRTFLFWNTLENDLKSGISVIFRAVLGVFSNIFPISWKKQNSPKINSATDSRAAVIFNKSYRSWLIPDSGIRNFASRTVLNPGACAEADKPFRCPP
jgi:hypothetical protein